MLEIASALAGIFSLVLTVVLEWDRISGRLNELSARARTAQVTSAHLPADGRHSSFRRLLDLLKTLLSLFASGYLFLFNTVMLLFIFGVPVTQAPGNLVLLAALAGGIIFGALVLRRRSWRALGLFVLIGAVLFVVLAMIWGQTGSNAQAINGFIIML